MSRSKGTKKYRRENGKQIRIIAAIILSVIFVYLGYTYLSNHNSSSLNKDNASNIRFLKQGELFFIQQNSKDTIASIAIEIADDEREQAQGLMYRQTLPADAGMLFIFEREEIRSFWMKNTYIALDILYIDEAGKITNIHENCEPLKEWEITSDAPALYVLEVNAGFCNMKGIKVGDIILYERD